MGEIDVSESQNVEDFDNFSKIVYSSCSLTYPITNGKITIKKVKLKHLRVLLFYRVFRYDS